jgi:hypothetical protein
MDSRSLDGGVEEEADVAGRDRGHRASAGCGQVSRRCSQSATYTRPTSTGTSINGPTTPARASPEVAPKTPTETAIASSKLLLGAVNAGAAVWS